MNKETAKNRIHRPVFFTVKQALQLYQFLDDFEFEFNKYAGQATAIKTALRRVIPDKHFE